MAPSALPIQFERVWKRYQLGSQHDSLRDAIPALWKRFTKRNGRPYTAEEFWALQDVTFHVKKGETLGLVGPNGAGKSTVLKLLSRITSPTKGRAAVKGRLAALIELGGGFHPDLSGAENIYLQGTMLGMRHRDIGTLYDSIVAFSELESFLHMPVKRYSSGMVVRLGFAIAAHVHPEILLIDEVLAVGDMAFQQKCFRRIDELRGLGTTMIFISHNLDAVQKLCDRVVLLGHGQMVGEGEPAEMVRRYRNDVLNTTLRGHRGRQLTPGAGPLRICDIILRDADHASVESVETGQAIRVDVSFEADRPIRHPSFRISLERLDGILCHAVSSRGHGAFPARLEGAGVVSLDYSAVNLLPNLYQVTVEVFEEDGLVPLAAVRQQRFFQVVSDHHEHGMVHLEHLWSAQTNQPIGTTGGNS